MTVNLHPVDFIFLNNRGPEIRVPVGLGKTPAVAHQMQIKTLGEKNVRGAGTTTTHVWSQSLMTPVLHPLLDELCRSLSLAPSFLI